MPTILKHGDQKTKHTQPPPPPPKKKQKQKTNKQKKWPFSNAIS